MGKILIVDDEVKIREVIKEYAILYGHTILEANDGEEAIRMVENDNFDLIILDIMMPNLDGYNACKQIKKIKKIPVIMLSARQEEYDKLYGFELGIDDFVTKPFSPKELMARVKVVLERNHTGKEEKMVFNTLIIDIAAHKVTVNDEVINMTPREYELLVYMAKNKNIALSRSRLLEEVWNYDYYGDDRTVDTHVKMLRARLREYRHLIVTIRGMGYKFEV